MTILNTFANQSGQIPLSQLDTNFATPITIGTTPIALGDTATTISGLILSGANLGTPTGNLANCTFPTLNQNTTGTASSVTGLVNVGNGGTGLTSLTAGYIPYGNGTGALNSSSGLSYDGNLNIGSGTDANTLRFLDIYNINTGSSAGSIMRLITSNVAGSGLAIVDIIKYKTGAFTLSNNETDTVACITFNVGTTEKIRIDSSGRVGIGTSSPATKLQLATAANTGLLISSTDGTTFKGIAFNTSDNQFTVGTQTNHPLAFFTNNLEYLRITTAGGISFGSSGTAYGSVGQVLSSNGNAPPTWSSVSIGNLTGAVTSVGNATSLGSFTSAQLATALTDETGTGSAVFATSPTITSPVISGTPSGVGTLTSATVQTAPFTVTTAATFTGIPSWVKRITVMLNGVSTTSNGVPTLRLGTSSGVENTTYSSTISQVQLSAVLGQQSANSGFELVPTGSGGYIYSGNLVLTNISGNAWILSGNLAIPASGFSLLTAGNKTLAGVLTQLQLTTTGGSDTFDAGTINIMYE